MNPGREMDALVAEKVMGWVANHDNQPAWYTKDGQHTGNYIEDSEGGAWSPSTDITAAWEVFVRVGISHLEAWEEKDGWRLCLGDSVAIRGAETVPHAICLAALKALGVVEPSAPPLSGGTSDVSIRH